MPHGTGAESAIRIGCPHRSVSVTSTAMKYANWVLRPATGTGLSDHEAAALDVAVLAAYREKGITTDPRTWRRPTPLLADLAAALADGDQAGRALAVRLRPYVAGSFKALFDGPTAIPPVGHLMVYAIKELPDELLPIGT